MGKFLELEKLSDYHYMLSEVNPRLLRDVNIDNCFLALSKGKAFLKEVLSEEFKWWHGATKAVDLIPNDLPLILHIDDLNNPKNDKAEFIILSSKKDIIVLGKFSPTPYDVPPIYRGSLDYITTLTKQDTYYEHKDLVKLNQGLISILGF